MIPATTRALLGSWYSYLDVCLSVLHLSLNLNPRHNAYPELDPHAGQVTAIVPCVPCSGTGRSCLAKTFNSFRCSWTSWTRYGPHTGGQWICGVTKATIETGNRFEILAEDEVCDINTMEYPSIQEGIECQPCANVLVSIVKFHSLAEKCSSLP